MAPCKVFENEQLVLHRLLRIKWPLNYKRLLSQVKLFLMLAVTLPIFFDYTGKVDFNGISHFVRQLEFSPTVCPLISVFVVT